MKIVKSVEDLGILFNCISETIENETKDYDDECLGMTLATLGLFYWEMC